MIEALLGHTGRAPDQCGRGSAILQNQDEE